MQLEKFIHKIESRNEHGIKDDNYEFKKDTIIIINRLIDEINLLKKEIREKKMINNPFICFFCKKDLSEKISEETKNIKTNMPFVAYYCGECKKEKKD